MYKDYAYSETNKITQRFLLDKEMDQTIFNYLTIIINNFDDTSSLQDHLEDILNVRSCGFFSNRNTKNCFATLQILFGKASFTVLSRL